MGRKRKTRLDLPQRVYCYHGGYKFVPPVGKAVFLGRNYAEAMKRWAEVSARPQDLSTLGAVIDRYMREVAPTKAPRTYQDYIEQAKRLRAVFGHMRPDELTPPDIYEYMDRRGAPVRANREKSLLSAIYGYAIRWGAAKDNPCRLVSRNTERPRTRLVLDAEVERFKQYLTAQLQAYLDLKCLTGMRKGDLLALRLDAITPDGLAVRHGKTGHRLVYEWTEELREVVDRIRALRRPVTSLHLFITERTRKPYTTKGFNSNWQRAMQAFVAAGGARFTEHDLRAKVVTEAREAGQDAQKLAGHKNSAMTDRYVKARQVEKVTPLRRNKG